MDVNVAGLHKSSLKTEARLMVERSGDWYCWVPAFLAPSRKQSWACGSRDEGLHAGRALDGWMDGCSVVSLSYVNSVYTLRLAEMQVTRVVLGIASIY